MLTCCATLWMRCRETATRPSSRRGKIEFRGDGRGVCRTPGPEYAEEVADKLFRPFVTTKPSGMGVGLSIGTANHRRGAWRQSVGCEQPRGRASFHLTLPAAENGEGQHGLCRVTCLFMLSTTTTRCAKIARISLGSAGFSVPCDSAKPHLDALDSMASPMFLTDVRMPETDRFELLRRVRESSRPVPVIVMTGHGDVPLAADRSDEIDLRMALTKSRWTDGRSSLCSARRSKKPRPANRQIRVSPSSSAAEHVRPARATGLGRADRRQCE